MQGDPSKCRGWLGHLPVAKGFAFLGGLGKKNSRAPFLAF
jgi:hypothetical protein